MGVAPMTAGVRIRLAGVAKTFADGTRALHPTDLDIAAGETVAMLGPSGCGKTTALRLIAGLEAPDAGGRVLFDDGDVTALPIERRGVGMVFQSYALFPNMTVAGNVGYGLKVRGVPRAEVAQRVDNLLAMMHIGDLAMRRIDQLSGGQRQRVALARALAPRPRVLLLDEPLTALDAKLREALRIEIDGLLRGLGITTIYVTHDQAEALALGDRIVVMAKGRVAQIGTPRDIYDRPADAFVASFVGVLNRVARPGAPPLVFRPEAARLVMPDTGTLAGTVTSVFFMGERTRVLVDVDGSPVTVDASPGMAPRRGDRVGIVVDTARMIALEARC